jgi:hypothetical protein
LCFDRSVHWLSIFYFSVSNPFVKFTFQNQIPFVMLMKQLLTAACAIITFGAMSQQEQTPTVKSKTKDRKNIELKKTQNVRSLEGIKPVERPARKEGVSREKVIKVEKKKAN